VQGEGFCKAVVDKMQWQLSRFFVRKRKDDKSSCRGFIILSTISVIKNLCESRIIHRFTDMRLLTPRELFPSVSASRTFKTV